MKEGSHAESQTQAFEGAARQAADGKGQDPSPKPLRLPPVPPTETPALHLSDVRDLQRPGSHRRSEEHTSELQSRPHLVCRLLLEKKKTHLRDAVSAESPSRPRRSRRRRRPD